MTSPHFRHTKNYIVSAPAPVANAASSDVRVKGLPGAAQAAVVRKGLDAAATRHAPHQGCGTKGPAPLPSGERGEFEGHSPSSPQELPRPSREIKGRAHWNAQGRLVSRSSPSPSVAPEESYELRKGVSRKRNTSAQSADLSTGDLRKVNTGWHQSPEKFREQGSRFELLKRQTERMADALECQGIPVRKNVGDVAAIGEVTGCIDRAEGYRSICFLPLIAMRDRRPLINDLTYFQKHDPLGQYLRLAVVTTGERIPLYGPLRETMQKLHRDISRWAHEARSRYKIEVIFRGTEFTVDEAQTLHPHANVLYAPKKRLSKETWADFLSWTRKRLGAHWHDAGRLERPQEAIKYPFKPVDVDRLSPEALAWLYEQTARLKITQPMGAMKTFRLSLTHDVAINRFGKRHRVAREHPLKVSVVNRPGGARYELVRKSRREPCATKPKPGMVSTENIILCRTAPQFRFAPWAEPITYVQNYTRTPKTPEGRRRLDEIEARRRQARSWWDANGAPRPEIALAVARGQLAAPEGGAGCIAAFKVHTCRSTVQSSERPDRPPEKVEDSPPGRMRISAAS